VKLKPGVAVQGGIASQKLIQQTAEQVHVTRSGEMVLTNFDADLPTPHQYPVHQLLTGSYAHRFKPGDSLQVGRSIGTATLARKGEAQMDRISNAAEQESNSTALLTTIRFSKNLIS
jgi:hypothetical protein